MSLKSQSLFHIPPWDIIPSEFSPKGTCKFQCEVLGSMVSVKYPAHEQINVINTHYICIHTHTGFIFTSILLKFPLQDCMVWLIQDWTLSWQVGRELKIIWSPSFKWSGRWHAGALASQSSLWLGLRDSTELQRHPQRAENSFAIHDTFRRVLREKEKSSTLRETENSKFVDIPVNYDHTYIGFSETPQPPPCLLYAWTVAWTIVSTFISPIIPECTIYMWFLLCIPSLRQSPWHEVITNEH